MRTEVKTSVSVLVLEVELKLSNRRQNDDQQQFVFELTIHQQRIQTTGFGGLKSITHTANCIKVVLRQSEKVKAKRVKYDGSD